MSDMTPEKLWPIGGYAPGNYSCICLKCGQTHIADKRAFHCADCMLQAQAAEITRLRAQVDGLREALALADAALSGANMDMKYVWRKVKAALAEADTADAPCTCCDDTGITHQTERFCSCETGLAALATYQQAKEGGR